jgi:hypothetical protein
VFICGRKLGTGGVLLRLPPFISPLSFRSLDSMMGSENGFDSPGTLDKKSPFA